MIGMNEDYAYIAGLLDADGWISMHTVNQGTGYEQPNWLVGIVNRDLATLQWVHRMFGGFIRERTRNRRYPNAKNWSRIYDWSPDAAGVESFLIAIRPFLRIKKPQADLVLEFLTFAKGKRENFRLSQDQKQRRWEIRDELRKLNNAGLKLMEVS